MKRYTTMVCCLIGIVGMVVCASMSNSVLAQPVEEKTTTDETKEKDSMLATIDTLAKLMDRLDTIDKEIKVKTRNLATAATKEQRDQAEKAIDLLNEQKKNLESDFQKIATGTDPSVLKEAPKKNFDWQSEIQVLIEPIIQEIKSITETPRKVEKLRRDLAKFKEKATVVENALANLQQLMPKVTDRALKKKLSKVEKLWKDQYQQIQSQITAAEYQLREKGKDRLTMFESVSDFFKLFFQTRGLNLLLSLAAFVSVILGLRIIRYIVHRIWIGRKEPIRSFYTRLFNVIYLFLTVFFAFAASLGVLYIRGDWLLLSLAVIFLLGVSWTAKQGLPRFWEQIKFMLNLGNVKENERIVYKGIPWKVVSLNIYSELENPALSTGNIRLPLRNLTDMVSRPCEDREPWFPSNVGDWVILSDGTRGEVILQTPEMVKLQLRGGAIKTYVTTDFIQMNPLNITDRCRIKVTFGIDYAHQPESTHKIPSLLGQKLRDTLIKEGHGSYLAGIRVDFQSAAASSLDLVVIADFTKGAAPLYNALARAIQRICVDACTEYGWGIPFTQLVIHQAAQQPGDIVDNPNPTGVAKSVETEP